MLGKVIEDNPKLQKNQRQLTILVIYYLLGDKELEMIEWPNN